MSDIRNPVWYISSPPSATLGYVYGSRFLSLRIEVHGKAMSAGERKLYLIWFRKVFEISETEFQIYFGEYSRSCSDWECSVSLFVRSVFCLQSLSKIPIFECGSFCQAYGGEAVVYLPNHRGSGPDIIQACHWLMACFELVIKDMPLSHAEKDAAGIISMLRRNAPASTNVWGFIKAGFDAGIPFRQLPGKTYLFGQGVHGRWLESSYTDKTSVIASHQVRHKPIASEIMRMYGLPVSVYKVVKTQKEALAAAQDIGYPVVVKPADQDRGDGVAADLRSEQEVISAFTVASKLSADIMVEKHFAGRDYRLTVLDGQVIWAIERQPAAVTGNGRSTVKELVDEENRNSSRGNDRRTPLKKINLDNEAIGILSRDGLNLNSIPDDGRFVPLRRSSNVSKGGVPIAVFDSVHEDNLKLAEKAARVLKLDFAGVDLLIPDISRSWTEMGAAICEVNAQPGIGLHTASHLYQPILRKLLNGNGRIPVIVVVGGGAYERAGKTEKELLEYGLLCGVYDGSEIRINGETEPVPDMNCFQSGRFLVIDDRVGTAVITVSDDSILKSGLPFQRYDLLLVDEQDSGGGMEGLLDMILPACDGKVLTYRCCKETKTYLESRSVIAVTPDENGKISDYLPEFCQVKE